MCRITDESSCKNYDCVVLIIQDIAWRNVFLSQSLYAKNKTVRGKKKQIFCLPPFSKKKKKERLFMKKYSNGNCLTMMTNSFSIYMLWSEEGR